MTTEKVIEEFTQDFTSYIKSKKFKQHFPNVSFTEAMKALKEVQVYNFIPALEEYFFHADSLQDGKTGRYTLTDVPYAIRHKYLGLIKEDEPIVLPYNSVLSIIGVDEGGVAHYTSYHAFSDNEILIMCTYANTDQELRLVTMHKYNGVDYTFLNYELSGAGFDEKRVDLRKTFDTIGTSLTPETEIHHKLVGNLFLRMTDENEQKYLRTYKEEPATVQSLYIRESNKVPAVKIPKQRPVYIVLDKKKDEPVKHRTYTTSRIEHICSWIVRGHYRRLHNPNSFGMDRYGNRTLQGKTWIAPYRKGDESLPIKQVEKIVI